MTSDHLTYRMLGLFSILGIRVAWGAGEAVTLEEVVVTATKRQENIQDVPIAMTALSTAKLERLGADTFADFARLVPGLSLNEGPQNYAQFTIRGIGTSNTNGNTQSTVATYIDELPALDSFGSANTPDLRLFDIERVEVLRGPQGTLFGSGSLGGAIRVITNKPDTMAFHSKAETTLSSTEGGADSYGLNAMVNVPLVPQSLAMRAVVYDRRDGGYVDNPARGATNVNSERAYGGRIALRYVATDALALTGSILYQHNDPNDGPFVFVSGGGTYQYGALVPTVIRPELSVGNLLAEYSLPWATLTSSTTYARNNVHTVSDFTPAAALILGPFGFNPPPSSSQSDSYGRYFVQELRLASRGEGPWSWTGGLFYYHKTRESHFLVTVPGGGAVTAPLGFTSDVLFGATIPTPGEEMAAFGEVSYRMTDRLQATAGMRFFHDVSRYSETTFGFLNGGDTHSTRSTAESSHTPKFVLSYRIAPQSMAYVQMAEGYRVGQNNPAIPPDPITGVSRPKSYRPDSLWNYEVGIKSSLFDGALVANAALYRINWRDIQIDQLTPDQFNYIANAGKAHSQGAELELNWQPLPGLLLATAASVSDARLDNNNPAVGGVRGDRLPGSAQFTLSDSAQYSFPLRGKATSYLRLNHVHVGAAYSALDHTMRIRYGDYDILGARAGVQFPSWEIALFVNNVTNNDATVNATAGLSPSVVRLRPRTAGL